MKLIPREIYRAFNRRDPRPPGWRETPEKIVLTAREGGPGGGRPPVRIFIGTEPDQHRAERVMIWSIEQARDPGRRYEIYLMKDLVGFNRERWLTGFTNYRIAIPHLAGGNGRAIYNDVDQIYLTDPAELFDTHMAGHGYLCISPRDTSVMLIDCERMAAVWTIDAAQRERRKAIEERARAIPGLWGSLAPEWNSRDLEYVAGQSKVLHFTTIHTQPWQPCPERFVYQPNPVGPVWSDLEQAADDADFQVFSSDRPSAEYQALVSSLRSGPTGNGASAGKTTAHLPELQALLEEAAVTSILDYRLLPPGVVDERISAPQHITVTRYTPSATQQGGDSLAEYDAVLCLAGLELLPEEDVPWTLELLFSHARRCVYLHLRDSVSTAHPRDGSRVARPLRGESWWLRHLEQASRHRPAVRWKLVIESTNILGQAVRQVREGGRPMNGRPPTVWVLTDDKAGHTIQSVGLAEALGWPYEKKELHFNRLNRLNNRVLGATTVSIDKRLSTPLVPPWPDLVITTGRRAAPVARWIGQQSPGRTKLVHLGRKGGELADLFDLVVTCAHFRLPLHPRRMEIIAPLTTISGDLLTAAADKGGKLLANAPRPHLLLVVGGTSATHKLDAVTAERMGREVRAFADAAGGSLFTITSPRTGSEATRALRVGLGEGARLHEWSRGERHNPYLGYLAQADVAIVTGESESMLAEAIAAGKHVLIYRLPERRPRLKRRFAEWIVQRANARPRKKKGTVRPQQGMEYVCARLIERGIVRPPRDINELHRALIRRGVARCFGVPLDDWRSEPLCEVDAVAHRVQAMLGYNGTRPATRLEPPQATLPQTA